MLVPLGTRPEIVKLAPVITALRGRDGLDVHVVATGQHGDPAMSGAFFNELGVAPDASWSLEGDEPERVGRLLTCAYRSVEEHRPDVVLVLGDTYTVPVFCLASRRHGVPLIHLEAGLRSFNETSLEEMHRRMAAATASLHLAPTELAARFLRDEGIDRERIRVVGNPVIDTLRARDVRSYPPDRRCGVVVTAHRANNVDDPVKLAGLVRLVVELARRLPPVVFPLHPRTRKRLEAAGALDELRLDGIRLLEPQPYEQMLSLLGQARVIVTDSGGLQEEAAWLGVPVIILRRSTPRWEGVAAGSAVLTGLDVDLAVNEATRLASPDEQARVAAIPCPYGDGRTGERVADLLCDPQTRQLLRLTEADYVGRAVPR